MELTTDRLLLKPIRRADADDIERVIFEDPEVVKGLAHDGSDAEVRRSHSRNWSGFGPDGDSARWHACETGLYAITDHSGVIAPAGQFLGVAGFYLEQQDGRWGGELFYALGSAFHGQGIMSEACAAVMARFSSLPDAGSLYAVYWRLLNPASGRILAKLGFTADGSVSLLEEYDADIAASIRDFEIWRLANAAADQKRRIAIEAATKLGHLENDGISSPADNLAALLGALGDDSLANDFRIDIEAALERGRETPGYAVMRYQA